MCGAHSHRGQQTTKGGDRREVGEEERRREVDEGGEGKVPGTRKPMGREGGWEGVGDGAWASEFLSDPVDSFIAPNSPVTTNPEQRDWGEAKSLSEEDTKGEDGRGVGGGRFGRRDGLDGVEAISEEEHGWGWFPGGREEDSDLRQAHTNGVEFGAVIGAMTQ